MGRKPIVSVQPKAVPLKASSESLLDELTDENAFLLAEDIAFEKEVKARRAPALTVLASGSDSFGRPVVMLPNSSMAVMNNLLCRAETQPSEAELEPPSQTITGLLGVVKAISEGEDITPYREHIQQVAANQPEKAEVVNAYLNQFDFEKIATYAFLEERTLRHIRRAIQQKDVSMAEALVVWQKVREDGPQIRRNMQDRSKPVDTVTVCEKIDYRKQQVEHSVARRWEGTTPQGRELIRKKLWVIQREMLAKLGVYPTGTEPTELAESDEVPVEEAVPVPA
jgi:hypothetical protein